MSYKNLFLSFVLSLLVNGLFAQALYSNTTYVSRFNPGVGSLGTPVVAYDDVQIPEIAGSDSISITKINVGIRRAPNAPATKVNLYYSIFEKDSTGSYTIAKSAQVFLGTVSLPVNGNSLVTKIITFGDSVSTLFKVKSEIGMAKQHGQKFLIGASFDNPSPANGIILTKDVTENANSIWIDNIDNNKTAYVSSFNGNIPATYYLEVFGSSQDKQGKGKNLYSDVAFNKSTEATITK